MSPAAASIARLDLDAALWRSAISANVDARQQVTVQQVTGIDPFRVTTTIGEFETRAVVNASGRWSNLNLPHIEETLPEKSARDQRPFYRTIRRTFGGSIFLRWWLLRSTASSVSEART